MKKRSVGVFAVLCCLLVGLMGRVFQLSTAWFAQAAGQQSTKTVTVVHGRGTIYDCQMRPLVNDNEEYRVSAIGTPQALTTLSELLTEEALTDVIQRLEGGYPAVVSVDGLIPSAPGLMLFSVPVRNTYPQLAPHVIGYLDSDGLHGVTGLELVFDKQLAAAAGQIQVTYTVDGLGKVLQGVAPTVTDTLSNCTGGVALTIDRDIQIIAEDAAKKYLTKGAVVVMEPSTGRIKAMVSLPDYQANDLSASLEDPASPLVNRALSNYNLGSVFKIVSTAAALEYGIPKTACFTCTGSILVGTKRFKCHYPLGHGVVNMTEGFLHSCNPYYIQLMQETGGNALYSMASSMGFDRSILLADGYRTACATMPSEAELQSLPVLANLSFGQGLLMASPVHVAQMVATVLNGGQVIRPTILQGFVDAQGMLTEEAIASPQLAFSKNTADILRQMMIETVERGTGKSGKPAKGGAGAKTGTAETGWTVTEGSSTTMVQSWYAGFYPASSPKYVLVVLAEDSGTTGQTAAPVFKEISDQLYAAGKA